MKIGIDITPVIYDRGVSRYTSNLIQALANLNTKHHFTAFGSSLRQHHKLKSFIPENFSPSLHHHPPKILEIRFNKLGQTIESFTGPLDVFHAWDWYLPPTKKTKLVTTVHDLALFKYPDTAHQDIKKHHQQTLDRIKTHHIHVIAVSQSTKQDLIELFDIPSSQISVIYEALPQENMLQPDKYQIEKVREKYTIQKPFLLCVGVNEPRKNYPNIIQAWQEFKKDYLLVIAGANGWQAIDTQEGIITTGHVDTRELASLYSSANALVYTSMYEGFGLPILEAFHFATPVVTSNLSSMPEVAGDAAVLVDPNSPTSISKGIKEALNNSNTYITGGKKQLQKFSWQKTASQTLNLYQKVGQS